MASRSSEGFLNMKRKKRALTLLEVMIVITLITLITGVIGVNMKGSLDKGKAFRSERAIEQLHDLLQLCLNEGWTIRSVLDNPSQAIESLGIAKNPRQLLKDGWNEDFQIRANEQNTDFIIESKRLNSYNQKHISPS
jgi:general secretion pathway protein G